MVINEPTPVSAEKFAFGKNWEKFIRNSFSSESLLESKKNLSIFLKEKSLTGLSFLDVGSGSGLHSLAAFELGAEKIMSIDIDAYSIACVKSLKKKANLNNRDWNIKTGSLLDLDFVKNLGTYDIVYCWGVAHHTGDMWRALENLIYPVKSGGKLFLAIYNHVEGKLGSKMWVKIKKLYNTSPFFIKKIIEWVYILWSFLMLLVRFNNPFSVMRKYKQKRGMSWSTDLVDWLGGYPYEYATVKEIFEFYHNREFILENIKTTNYIGCNQFLFIKNK